MPRPRIVPATGLEKYRLERTLLEVKSYAASIGMNKMSVYRVERGEIVRRITAVKYLTGLKIDISNPASYPPGLKIIDLGARVQVQLTPQH